MPSLTVQQLFHGTSPYTCLLACTCTCACTVPWYIEHSIDTCHTWQQERNGSSSVKSQDYQQHTTKPTQYHNERQHTSNCLLLARLARLRCRPQLLLSECPDTRHPFSPHSVHGDIRRWTNPRSHWGNILRKKGVISFWFTTLLVCKLLPVLLIIAHITYLFERLTFASDRKERNNRDSNFGARYSARWHPKSSSSGTHYQSRTSWSHL